jgi:hypothetical protein
MGLNERRFSCPRVQLNEGFSFIRGDMHESSATWVQLQWNLSFNNICVKSDRNSTIASRMRFYLPFFIFKRQRISASKYKVLMTLHY